MDRLHTQDDTLIFFDKGREEGAHGTPWSTTLVRNPLVESNDMKLWKASLILKLEKEKEARMPPKKPRQQAEAAAAEVTVPMETVATIDPKVPHTRVRTQLRKRGRLSRPSENHREKDDEDDDNVGAIAAATDDDDDFALTPKEIRALKAPLFEATMRAARRDAFALDYFPSGGVILITLLVMVALMFGAGAVGYILARDGGDGECNQ